MTTHDLSRSLVLTATLALAFAGCASEGSNLCIAHEGRIGEPCVDTRCVDGATCSEGLCVATVEAGGACDAGAPCSELLVCEAGTCVGMAAGAGERCVLEAAGTCAEGLACVRYAAAEPECAVIVAAGERCRRDGECPEPLVCAGSVCGELPLEGEPCSASGACAPGSVCGRSPDDRCLPAPVSEGDLCGDECPEGLSCQELLPDPALTRRWSCAPALGEGETCEGDTCAAGLACLLSVCVPDVPRAEGERCSDDRWCVEGAHCNGGRCVVPIPVGSPCGHTDSYACGRGARCDFGSDPWHWGSDII